MVDRDEPTFRHEAVQLVGLDAVLAQGVQHDEHGVSEVVDFGKVEVLDRVSHRERIKAELLRETHQFAGIVGSCGIIDSQGDVDPHPSG